MKKIKFLAVFFIFSAALCLTFFQTKVLILQDLSNNNIVFAEKIKPDDEFTMRWMHSVELQPWEEIFRISNGYDIVLDRTRFKSFGAGVPDQAGNKTEIKDGYVIFSGINQKMPDLRYGISDFAKHTFYFKNKNLKLYEVVKNGEGIKIYTDSVKLIKYLYMKAKLI